MGMMNFINLAHGAFAMLGGYVSVTVLSRLGVPFLASLPLAFLASAVAGLVLERLLYRRLYPASHLNQVLFSIGLTFMSVAGATWLFGPTQQPVTLPDWLRGQVPLLGLERLLYRRLYQASHLDQVLFSIGLVFMAVASVDYFVGSTQQIMQLPEWLRGRTEIGSGALTLGMGHYRLFIIAVCAALTVGLQYVLTKTRFGSRLRASVDDQRVAAGMGINVNIVFLSTFAFGSGLAGLGGALGAEVLGLDPSFPLKFMIYFLIVVAVGGT
eukprot:gene37656-42649_t